MSSDDDDYMSDKFLNENKESRPGLIHSVVKKRQVEIEKQQKIHTEEQKAKKLKPSEEKERLQEGLSNPISTSNKGFAMLAKMGYKSGQSLGKKPDGIVEPISIQIKSDRGGFGREAALRQLEENKIKIRKAKLDARKGQNITIDEFRKRMTQKNEERFYQSALRKCQRVCQDLDTKENVEIAATKWFWPPAEESSDEESESSEEEEEEFTVTEKVEMLTYYLRTSYNYCHWCGVAYSDVKDISDNCPGLYKDDH